MARERFLVTGSNGFLGAWITRKLALEGTHVVGFDRAANDYRLRQLIPNEAFELVTFVQGDLAERGAVLDAVGEFGVTHIVHCAALQVPFCQADPIGGAQVNVVGTVAVFEAVREHRDQIQGLAFASAAAVFGPPEMYEPDGVADDSTHDPEASLYGVYKQANEWTAKVYERDHGIVSTGLRPWVAYGVGRDQGMTSTVTKAMYAAASGVPYRITFGGTMLYQYGSDLADTFVAAARARPEATRTLNVGGSVVEMAGVVRVIEECVPEIKGQITFEPEELPVVVDVRTDGLTSLLGGIHYTNFADGVAATVQTYQELISTGVLPALDATSGASDARPLRRNARQGE